MPVDKIVQSALAGGRNQAEKVLAVRAVALKKRAKALKAHSRKILISANALSELGSPAPVAGEGTVGMLVAEGDSWFDYPLHDVLKLLEDDHGYDVESVAHKGDPIEIMAYGEHQLNDFTRLIEKVTRRGAKPKAILLSGGGNDIAGDEFGMLLNHAGSAIAGLNLKVVEGVIDDRIRAAYVFMLSSVTRICEQMIGVAIPILVHGYDYPVPDGRGFMGGWGPFPGPWLEPGFREKGYENLDQRVALAQALIDRFNEMLAAVASLPEFPHVKYIDLRKTLSNGAAYKRSWANELHPTGDGFGKITNKFAAVLENL